MKLGMAVLAQGVALFYLLFKSLDRRPGKHTAHSSFPCLAKLAMMPLYLPAAAGDAHDPFNVGAVPGPVPGLSLHAGVHPTIIARRVIAPGFKSIRY